jgi:hypothetical protein
MSTKYIKNKSGYCYKIVNNKKTRISETEYKEKKKRSKIQGGNDIIQLIKLYYDDYHKNNTKSDFGNSDDINYIQNLLLVNHKTEYTYKQILDIVQQIENKKL